MAPNDSFLVATQRVVGDLTDINAPVNTYGAARTPGLVEKVVDRLVYLQEHGSPISLSDLVSTPFSSFLCVLILG